MSGKAFRGVRVEILPAAAILFVGMVLTDRSLLCFSGLLAAAVHECGHLIAAKLLKIPLRTVRLDLLGARLDVSGRMISYGEEWLLCAAGPLCSLLFAAVPAAFWNLSEFARLLSCVSLFLGVLNLLPVRTFDGGRMLSATLSGICGERFSEAVLTISSFTFLFLLWCVAVYCLLKVGDGLSLFCFSMSLFARFFDVS